MLSNNYSFTPNDQLVHDYGDTTDSHLADALVASGDCFITLATQLDELTHHKQTTANNIPVLEEIIRTLIYLQRHYAITKKIPNYRQ